MLFRKPKLETRLVGISDEYLKALILTIFDLMRTPLSDDERADHILTAIKLFLKSGVYER